MRVLLDEQMPRGLLAELAGHEIRTVGQMGWKGLDNGQLLARAADRFDVLISMDRNMPVEHDLSQYRLGAGARPRLQQPHRGAAPTHPRHSARVGRGAH